MGCSLQQDPTSCSTPSELSAKWCGLHLAGLQYPRPNRKQFLMKRYIRCINKINQGQTFTYSATNHYENLPRCRMQFWDSFGIWMPLKNLESCGRRGGCSCGPKDIPRKKHCWLIVSERHRLFFYPESHDDPCRSTGAQTPTQEFSQNMSKNWKHVQVEPG